MRIDGKRSGRRCVVGPTRLLMMAAASRRSPLAHARSLTRPCFARQWFRSGDAVYMKKLEEAGIVAKFVIGSGKTAPVKEAFASEQQRHDDFLVLPIVEDYHNLVNKTREFIRAVMESYEPKYIVKVDDDVYLKLTRLPEAVKQWESRQVDYTGCMKRGPVYHDPSNRWYEPQHALLGSEYFSHCWGSLVGVELDRRGLACPDRPSFRLPLSFSLCVCLSLTPRPLGSTVRDVRKGGDEHAGGARAGHAELRQRRRDHRCVHAGC